MTGIILAAGASSRMGSPKALLEYKGETFIDRLIRIFSNVCGEIIVVLGYHADAVRPGIEGKAQIVINPDPDRGQLSSLQTALRAMSEHSEGFLFLPVDCPSVEIETVQKIVNAYRTRDSQKVFVIPRYRDKRGHPVSAASSLREKFLALPASGQARDVVHRHIADTVYVDVDDPGILADIDYPEAYRRLTEITR